MSFYNFFIYRKMLEDVMYILEYNFIFFLLNFVRVEVKHWEDIFQFNISSIVRIRYKFIYCPRKYKLSKHTITINARKMKLVNTVKTYVYLNKCYCQVLFGGKKWNESKMISIHCCVKQVMIIMSFHFLNEFQ